MGLPRELCLDKKLLPGLIPLGWLLCERVGVWGALVYPRY